MDTEKQTTLGGSFSLFGKGLHTGLSLTVTFNPAPENYGYKIQRIDLEGQPIVDAVAENVVETNRGTVVQSGEARISTIEHGMSALYALGIDNCLIQVNGPEFPILDGAADAYVKKIMSVGIVKQNAPKDYYIIRKKIEVRDEESGSIITILPDEDFSITAMCSFDSKFISSQFATLDNISNYATEIAPARTFVFVRDVVPCLKPTSSKVATSTMPSSSMSVRWSRTSSTSSPTCSTCHISMPQKSVTSSTARCNGTTSAHATSCSTSSATWPSSANPSRDVSLPPDPGTLSTISSHARCAARYANTRCRLLSMIPTTSR